MIYLSHSRPSSPSFYPSHFLFLFFSICLVLFPSSFINAQQIAATGLPTTLTLPLAAPLTATVTYSVNAQSTLVVSLIQTLQNNERSVGESSTTVNAGNNQQTTVTNIRIPTNLPSSGPGITYKWRIYSVNPDTYSFSPSIAFNARTASQEQTGITVTAAAPATTLPPTTTTIRATTIVGQSTTTAKAGVSTTTAKAGVSTTRTTTRPITTLRSTLAPGGGGPGDQPTITDPPTGTIYKIISSTAVAGRMGMCAYTYQDGDTLSDIVIKLETTLGRLIQLNLDKFQQADYVPQAGDVLQYDCFIAEGSQTDDNDGGGAPVTRPPGSSQQQRSSSSSNKSWVDNNVVIFIVLLVVGFCLLAFLSIVLYKHIQAQFSTDNTTKKMVTEARAAPPMSTPANRNWGTTNA